MFICILIYFSLLLAFSSTHRELANAINASRNEEGETDDTFFCFTFSVWFCKSHFRAYSTFSSRALSSPRNKVYHSVIIDVRATRDEIYV